MALPTSRNTTYAAGVTQVKSADLNDIQDQIIALETARLASKQKPLGPSRWQSNAGASAGLNSVGGYWLNLTAAYYSEMSLDLDNGDTITNIEVVASQSTAGTLTASLHTIDDVGAVSAAIASATSTATGGAPATSLSLTALTSLVAYGTSYLLRVWTSGTGSVSISNTYVTYDPVG